MHHDKLAEDIVAARLARRTLIKPSDQYASFDLAEAYQVGGCVAARWTGLGNTLCGVKIGLTKRSSWAALGLRHPVWAPLYRDAVFWGADVRIGDMVAPRIEAEIVVGLASALGPAASCDEIAGAVAWAALGFELVDSHFPGWQLTPPDLVADFGCHAGLAVGQRQGELDVLGVKSLADLGVTLFCDGEQVAHGRGADVLGGPLAALEELLAGPDAPQLNPGDIVATGSLTGGALAVAPGQRWRATPQSGSRLAPIDLRMVA